MNMFERNERKITKNDKKHKNLDQYRQNRFKLTIKRRENLKWRGISKRHSNRQNKIIF